MNKLPIRRIDFSDSNEKKQYENLTHLAQEMIDMNEKWRIEQRRFFDWIQEQLHILPDKKGHIGIDALSGKTTIKKYPGNYEKSEEPADFSDILKVLQKNRSKIRANLSDAAFVRTLEREYEKSLAILLPIKDRLAKTDWLIDQIVYKLYGLTEEEIAIVEGRG